MSADPNERVAVRYQGRTVRTGRREDAERLTQDQIEGLYRLHRRSRFERFSDWGASSGWRLAAYWIVMLGPVAAVFYAVAVSGLLDLYTEAWGGVLYYVGQTALIVSFWRGDRRSKVLAVILAVLVLATLGADVIW